MRAPTARVVLPASMLWTGHRLRRLSKDQLAVVCESCDWYVIVPLRLGFDHADALRSQHLLKVHSRELVSGRMAWRLPREGVPA